MLTVEYNPFYFHVPSITYPPMQKTKKMRTTNVDKPRHAPYHGRSGSLVAPRRPEKEGGGAAPIPTQAPYKILFSRMTVRFAPRLRLRHQTTNKYRDSSSLSSSINVVSICLF